MVHSSIATALLLLAQIDTGSAQTCTYTLSSDSLSWSGANAACQAAGLQLARVQSAAQNALLLSAMSGVGCWIGGTDSASEGTWVWSPSNTPISYTNWASGEPSGGGNEGNCMAIQGDGYWNDANCASTKRYHCQSCEASPPPPPPSPRPPPPPPSPLPPPPPLPQPSSSAPTVFCGVEVGGACGNVPVTSVNPNAAVVVCQSGSYVMADISATYVCTGKATAGWNMQFAVDHACSNKADGHTPEASTLAHMYSPTTTRKRCFFDCAQCVAPPSPPSPPSPPPSPPPPPAPLRACLYQTPDCSDTPICSVSSTNDQSNVCDEYTKYTCNDDDNSVSYHYHRRSDCSDDVTAECNIASHDASFSSSTPDWSGCKVTYKRDNTCTPSNHPASAGKALRVTGSCDPLPPPPPPSPPPSPPMLPGKFKMAGGYYMIESGACGGGLISTRWVEG